MPILAWTIEIDPAAARELKKLDRQSAARIVAFLEKRIAPSEDPRSVGEALHGPRLGSFWKYRVGDHRIIASIEDAAVTILVIKIGNRREVYKRR
jgi:mRNA interferase RelE/StbE